MRIITVIVKRKLRPGVTHVGIPLFLVWLLVLPIVILLSPVILIGCMIAEQNPLTVFSLFWEILSGVAGTQVEVDDREHIVSVSVSQEES
jgi:hypothetical protein